MIIVPADDDGVHAVLILFRLSEDDDSHVAADPRRHAAILPDGKVVHGGVNAGAKTPVDVSGRLFVGRAEIIVEG